VRRSPHSKTSSLPVDTPHNSETIMGWRRAAPGFRRLAPLVTGHTNGDFIITAYQ
jgi:hypothetical protein